MILLSLAFNRFGSDYLKREFLAPSISGDYVSCLGVSEVGSGSDVASELRQLFIKMKYPILTFLRYVVINNVHYHAIN